MTELADMTSEDLQRSFHRTFLGLRKGDRVHPVYIDRIEGANFVLPEESLYYKDPRIVYEHPDSGFYAVNDTLYWVERLPTRQWHKGVKTSLLHVSKVSSRRTATVLDYGGMVNLLTRMYNNVRPEGVSKYSALSGGYYWYKGINLGKDLDAVPTKYVTEYINSCNLKEFSGE
jgi:hypothetical protein